MRQAVPAGFDGAVLAVDEHESSFLVARAAVVSGCGAGGQAIRSRSVPSPLIETSTKGRRR
jgi:hypothetical protein